MYLYTKSHIIKLFKSVILSLKIFKISDILMYRYSNRILIYYNVM